MARYLKKSSVEGKKRSVEVEAIVRGMLSEIERDGDEAIRRYARDLDNWEADFRVPEDTIRRVVDHQPETFKQDFAFCQRQIQDFAKRQLDSMQEFEAEFGDGITLGQKLIPVRSVGCYIPGGKYPLVNATLMSVGTARVAGCEHIVGCAPPRGPDGIFPSTLYGLHAAGADEIYCLGGVQALAAMAYGLVGMRAADLITGPGNAFVSEAKRQLFGVVGIDLLAGPTEILVIADDSADPSLVATDLLGQAEHGPDSPAWLITTSKALGQSVIAEVERQLDTLPTRDIASRSWADFGEVVVTDSDDEAIEVSDQYAPEHLEVMTHRNDYYLEHLRNYGSLFVGEESTVAYGDKGVGTNHTLPTGKASRYTGGLWVGKFIKTVTYQRLTPEASHRIAPTMSRQCEVEGMLAHKITADVRHVRYKQ
jgi:sulfopropanediol 3-dehydrogenase